jgi:CheY-like chemotaxis protein
VHIGVQDHGEGISREYIDNIFDPFFSTREKGSGLGLAVSHAIIRNHKGSITVDSTPGSGTTFHIYLPASPHLHEEAKTPDDEIHYGTGRILLMDDDEIVQAVAPEIISQLGYEVETAANGREAVSKYHTARESGRPFDLLILDLTVPGGMGGLETLREIQATDPGVKAVVSSGYANDSIMAEYRRHGFAGVVPKPYKIQEISKVLHEILRQP